MTIRRGEHSTMARSILAAIGMILLFSAAGCRESPSRTLLSPDVLITPSLQVAISVSRVDAKVGDRVDVMLTLESEDDIDVSLFQGTLVFDATRFRYSGQLPTDGTLTVVNESRASDGELRLLSFRLDGLIEKATALAFTAVEAGYIEALTFRPELAADAEGLAIEIAPAREVTLSAPLSALEPLLSGEPTAIARLAGYRLSSQTLPETASPTGPELVIPVGVNLGDCNLDNSVDGLDLVAVALIAVGVDASPSDPSDFRVCDVDASGVITALDVMDVSRFAVGVATIRAPVGLNFNPLALGFRHACALDSGGAASCWGYNFRGQLGDGTTASAVEAPVAVAGGHTFVSLSVAENYSCGLDPSGQVWCWGGEADKGTLGDGTLTDSPIPVAVDQDLAFIYLGSNVDDHVCGIDQARVAWCWGEQQGFGRLGDGVTTTSQGTPVQVAGGIEWAQVAAGWFFSCGLDVSGQAFCWGHLLNPAFSFGVTPIAVAVGQTFTSITSGFQHSCALDDTGQAWCWGWNGYGQLGNATSTDSPDVPVAVNGGHSFVRLSAARNSTCGVTAAGLTYCWGTSEDGQLGDGTRGVADCASGACRWIPVQVAGGHTFSVMEPGAYFGCGLDQASEIWCWGRNWYGQLGQGPTSDLRPYRLDGPTEKVVGPALSSMGSGTGYSCGLDALGRALCWGRNFDGQIGDGTIFHRDAATFVAGNLRFSSLALGEAHVCGVNIFNEGAYCWGRGSSGQLGDGFTNSLSQPTPVAGSPGTYPFASVETGSDHSCGILTTGGTACWGSNAFGQLADGVVYASACGNCRESPAPADVPIDTVIVGADTTLIPLPFTSLALGWGTSCGLVADGRAFCWGRGDLGQRGDGVFDGGTVFAPQPTPVLGGHVFDRIEGARFHFCGLESGVAYCWGDNFSGELGDGTTTGKAQPVAVSGGYVFDDLQLGNGKTCGVTVSGQSLCWGYNANGQLGDGTTDNQSVPVPVSGGRSFVEVHPYTGHACGREASGDVYCWGANFYGQIGSGVWAGSLVPLKALPPA